MADIDFDELDKAVSDLMANVDASKRLPGLDEPEEKTVTIPTSDTASSVVVPTSTPTVQTVEPSIAAEVAPTPIAASAGRALAVKRRGQFMDIMHPSRDMNTSKPVSRQGATIRPGNDIIAASAAGQNEGLAPEPASPEKQPVEASASAPSTWPDPIDMATSAAEVPLLPTQTPISETPVEHISETPLMSPFLPDAKPEKRPLGGASQPEDTISVPEISAVDAQTMPAVALPEEFSGDLMAVESRDLSSHPVQAAVPSQAPVEQPKLEPGEEETLIPAVATPDPIERPQTTTQPPAGGSIAQQYTEQPSSGDQSNGSIYDTSAYHQAIELTAPAKKKTPMSVWIMIGVGLLLLGAIGGAAYFYFTR